MTGKRSSRPSVERIAIAFAANDSESDAVEAFAGLIGGRDTHLAAVLIEDTDMLRAARLPFATAICRVTNIARPIDADEIDRGLRERAASLRTLVARTAERSGAQWSFSVIRQRTASAVLHLARDAEVTVFGSAGPAALSRPRLHHLLPATDSHPPGGHSIVVLFDRSGAAVRALRVARRLAQLHHLPIRVLVVAASQAGIDRLVGNLQRNTDLEPGSIRSLCRPRFEGVMEAVQELRPSATVVPITQVESESERIGEMRDTIGRPIVIVR